jgi:hypothetical protein
LFTLSCDRSETSGVWTGQLQALAAPAGRHWFALGGWQELTFPVPVQVFAPAPLHTFAAPVVDSHRLVPLPSLHTLAAATVH